MLCEISVDNLAIINSLDIELASGMTVLSGETGAGKSILVDALGLLLGDRASGEAVRQGCDKATISARFALHDAPEAAAYLVDQQLVDDADDDCVIRRTIAQNGRSRAWINATPVAVRELRTLGALLVDILGQHAHQRLMASHTQRRLLDEYGDHGETLHTVADAAARLNELRKRIAKLEQADTAGNMRIDLLRYQVDELEVADVAETEPEELETEHRRLAAAERLITDGRRADAALGADEGAVAGLATAERIVTELTAIDGGFGAAAELIASARIQADEAADSLRRHVDTLDIDPERLQTVESRLATLTDLARKHRCEPSELHALTQRLRAEVDELAHADERLTALKVEEKRLKQQYDEAAAALTEARREAARNLAAAITDAVRALSMPQANLEITVRPNAEARVSAHGVDTVAFRVATNPGQPAGSLSKVASGGELSRLSLAIEVVTVSQSRVPTLVFDEVDAGIGGGVAEIVGRQLRALGDNGQTLCVTHLPQVAVQANSHLVVAKQVEAGETTTAIDALDNEARVQEIARMLGGVELTRQTREHAAEMLARAG